MTGISINKHIYNILINDKELNQLVNKRIYPLIAEEGSQFPFIIFKRNELSVNYSKDGVINDEVSISVAVAAVNYSDCVNIMERVRKILEMRIDNIIQQSIITSVNEDYVDNSYIMEVNFNLKLK